MDILNTIGSTLRGYKTYILGSLALIVIALNFFGVVDSETTMTVVGALGFGGMLSLRSAISNLGSK